MVTKAIDDGLRPYSIGEKLRSLRLRKSMGLVELGRHTGLSAALLSKLERGKLYPTFLLTSANVEWSQLSERRSAFDSPIDPGHPTFRTSSSASTIQQRNAR